MKNTVPDSILALTITVTLAIGISIGFVIDDGIADPSIIIPIATLCTAGATIVFVGILYVQTKYQAKERSLTLRPIMVIDKNHPTKAIELEQDRSVIKIRLVNVGRIHTGKTRIFLLPLDRHAEFVIREDALKAYLKKTGNVKLESTDSCMVLRSIRERTKHDTKRNYFENYLILGEDFKTLSPKNEEFDMVLSRIKEKEEFEKAGKERAKSLIRLNPDEWDLFYDAGSKRGDILDKAGPIDWENFDTESSISREKVREVLKDEATHVYETAPKRKKIIDQMSPNDRKQFDEAIRKRQEMWNKIPADVAEDFAVASMKLRKAYKSIKDVRSKTANMLAPNHPVELRIYLDKNTISQMTSNRYAYFGVLVQYSKPREEEMEYTYYIQGYVDGERARMDYALDTLD